jgi:ectoine hydroxylase-related dioxygenase (phytanoyl-CoA dioxygenase family)
MGFGLTDIEPKTKKQIHIIVRINRPQSNDFNPPHKDIHENLDILSYIKPFVNFWIPIAGVNHKSSLPIAPKSHLINENQVLRTFDGGMLQGNQYRARMIKSWQGKSELFRSKVTYGQVLAFSGNMIHGLAVNDNPDKTRVSLELRLFKSS